jgi:hypothetical protein
MNFSSIFRGAYNGFIKKLLDEVTEKAPRQSRRRFASEGQYPQDANIIASGFENQVFSGPYRVDVRSHQRRLSNGTVAEIDAYSYDLEDQRILHYYTKEGDERYRTMGSANSPDTAFVTEVVDDSHNVLTDQLVENLRILG